MRDLERLGWSPFFAEQRSQLDAPDGPNDPTAPNVLPYRVASRQRDSFQLLGDDEPRWASARGRLFERGDLPCVGDWVLAATDPAGGASVIEHVLERRTKLERQAAGKRTEAQLIAANLDVVFVVTSAGGDLNPRRIERYLTAIWDGGAKPVVVINKADLAPDRDELAAAAGEIALIAPIAVTSAIDGDLEAIRCHLSSAPPTTTAFVGSSGVGKSTLVNALFGAAVQATGEIRENDEKGRHTTTARELLVSDAAGILIDTPGMRELSVWDGEVGVGETFREIEERAAMCRFGDCQHDREPGCAIKVAIADGSISEERLAAYHKLLREIAFHDRDKSAAARRNERLTGKRLGKMIREAKDAKKIKGR